jgi:hypothetical protein
MADVCRWCGEAHDVDRLCQRAQRGMTRRSFCFLFGAGVAAGLSGFWDRVDDPLFDVPEPTLYLYPSNAPIGRYFYGPAEALDVTSFRDTHRQYRRGF